MADNKRYLTRWVFRKDDLGMVQTAHGGLAASPV